MTLHVLHTIGSLELATLKRQEKINYRGKHHNLRMEKPGRNVLNQVTRVNPMVSGTKRYHVPPDTRPSEGQTSHLCFLPTLQSLNLIVRK